MKPAGWWLADLTSQLLDPQERAAVRGDLTEARVSGGRALLEVLGLVVRRHVALWAEWRPWVALLTIVVPIGIMLSHATRWWADAYAFDTLIYLGYPPWGRDLPELVWSATISAAALAGWSWTSGYVLAALSRRTAWHSCAVFAVIVFLGTLGTATIARANSDAFAGHVVGVVFPRLSRFIFVVLPVVWGIHCCRRGSLSRGMLSIGAVALIVLTLMLGPFLDSSLTLGRGTVDDLRPLWPISLLIMWPTAAILFSAWRRASISS